MKTNTKNNVLKLATAVLVFLFAANVVNAQLSFVDDDYAENDTAALAPNAIDYLTLKTGGTTMGYYANPDPIYHSNYNNGGGWSLTADFLWNWSFYSDPGVIAPALNKPTGTPANYVEATFNEIGSYRLDVLEQASAAFGGCVSADTSRIYVELVDPPTAQFAGGQGETGVCANIGVESLTVNITENVPDALATYAFRVSELVETIDAADAQIAEISNTADHVDHPLGTKVSAGGTSPDFTVAFNTSDMQLNASGNRTRYTYTLTSAAGVAGSGIVSAISHKSDYLAGQVNGHDFGAETTVVFVINPAPVTGPIYHIPNNFAL